MRAGRPGPEMSTTTGSEETLRRASRTAATARDRDCAGSKTMCAAGTALRCAALTSESPRQVPFQAALYARPQTICA